METIYILLVFSIVLIFCFGVALLIVKYNHYKKLEKQNESELVDKYLKLKQKYENEKNQLKMEVLAEMQEERDRLNKELEELRSSGLTEVEKIHSMAAQTLDDKETQLELHHKSRIEHYQKLESELRKRIDALKECLRFDLNEIKTELTKMESRQEAAWQALQAAEMSKDAERAYMIQLSQSDIEEISELTPIINKLKNPLPLKKAIYSIYYQQKVTDLISRVVGKGRVTGIYKITHIESGKTYVGQSVDIANRWRQHCRRGIGAETPTNNKLYPAMSQYGLQAFKFEIVEIVEPERLNEAEKYWQDFFGSKEFGYSMK